MIGLKDITEAADRIGPFIHKTPLVYSSSFSAMTGADIYLKAENLQKTGSFKVRGALNRIIGVPGDKVIAASMGNHAQGVAFAAQKLGKLAKIVMPVGASIVKQEATRGYGAEVILYGNSFSEALGYALSHEDHEFIHAFDDDAIIAGQGTVGLEIAEALKDTDYCLVPVGGGGLISGIAVAMKSLSGGTRIIGVQTAAAPSAYASFKDEKILERAARATIADGIAVGRVGDRPFEIIRRYVDDMVLVEDDDVAMSILLFLERKKLVVEGAGAATLAALLANKQMFEGRRVVLVVSGGNIDFTLIDRIIHKGLVISGRIGVFDVTVEDIPGRLQSLAKIIADRKGNILNVVHDRLSPDLPVIMTRVTFTVETKGKEHLQEILSALNENGFDWRKKEGM